MGVEERVSETPFILYILVKISFKVMQIKLLQKTILKLSTIKAITKSGNDLLDYWLCHLHSLGLYISMSINGPRQSASINCLFLSFVYYVHWPSLSYYLSSMRRPLLFNSYIYIYIYYKSARFERTGSFLVILIYLGKG